MTRTETTYRLPRTVIPSHYAIVLEPDLETGTFEGSEDVAVAVLEPVTEIALHAKELEITSAALHSADRSVPVDKVLLDAESERLTLALAEAADPGEWTLSL